MTEPRVIQLAGTQATPAEQRAAAHAAYKRALADGDPPSGAELGRWFDRSERWGRARIAEFHAGANGQAPTTRPRTRTRTTSAATKVPPSSSNGSNRAPPDPPTSNIGTEGQRSRRIIRWITTAAVIVVAACAARSSYEHQRAVVEMAGNHEAAWYLPLSVDGMMLIASLNMLVRRWDNHPAGGLTWTALLLGGAASLGANIAAAPPTWIGRLVAAWSPICLIVSYELLMQQLPHRIPSTSESSPRHPPVTDPVAADSPSGRHRPDE